jgi:hypothetical protein
MTAAETIIQIKVFLDKIDSQAYPEILQEELDLYVNEMIQRFVKTRYNENNLYKKGFEESQKRTDDLRTLVVTRFSQITEQQVYSSQGMHTFQADLETLFDDVNHQIPSTDVYMFFLKANVNRCKNGCCSWQRSKQVQQDDLLSITADPFNRPVNIPVTFFENGNLNVWVPDEVEVDNVAVTFIRRPAIFNSLDTVPVDIDLPEHTHTEIVQGVVGIILENIESQRQQSQQVLQVNKEE